jgi:hypothetical protein
MLSVAAPKQVFYSSLFNVKLLLFYKNLNLKNKKDFFIRVETKQETTMSKWTSLGKASTFSYLMKKEKFWVLGAGCWVLSSEILYLVGLLNQLMIFLQSFLR